MRYDIKSLLIFPSHDKILINKVLYKLPTELQNIIWLYAVENSITKDIDLFKNNLPFKFYYNIKPFIDYDYYLEVYKSYHLYKFFILQVKPKTYNKIVNLKCKFKQMISNDCIYQLIKNPYFFSPRHKKKSAEVREILDYKFRDKIKYVSLERLNKINFIKLDRLLDPLLYIQNYIT